MPLKGKPSPQAPASTGDSLEGPWGAIVPPTVSLDALRFSMEPEEIVSYAYRVVIRWKWKPGPPETITVLAGPDVVTVSGHGLKRLIDALDETRLKMVCQEGPSEVGSPPRTYILAIRIEEGGR